MPGETLAQLSAQNSENVRDRSRAAQEQFSVMREVAEPAQRAAFDEALNVALLGTISMPIKGTPKINNGLLDIVPEGFQKYPSGSAAIGFTDYGSITLSKTKDGKYIVAPDARSIGVKPFYFVGDNVDELISAASEHIKKNQKAIAGKEEKSLRGRLQKEFGDSFSFSGSTQSKSKYITHLPSGTKVRISDHALPPYYEGADLDLSSKLTDKQLFDEIRRFLRVDD